MTTNQPFVPLDTNQQDALFACYRQPARLDESSGLWIAGESMTFNGTTAVELMRRQLVGPGPKRDEATTLKVTDKGKAVLIELGLIKVEYVIRAIGFASPGSQCPHAGQWLLAFDFDAHGGKGFGQFTRDKMQAKRFPDLLAAFNFWRTTSAVRPMRGDGNPNRPLTCLTVQADPIYSDKP